MLLHNQEWYRGLCSAVPKALSLASLDARDIAAVSFSAGAHTPVLLDQDDNVIRPAILWSDQRSGVESRELSEQAGDMIHRRRVLIPTASLSLSI